MPRQGSTFKQLCKEDRVKLEILRRQKMSLSAISKELGFHKSTISRELRNINNHGYGKQGFRVKPKYDAQTAWDNHVLNKRKCGAKCKVSDNPELIKYIEAQVINKKWSPYVAIEYARINDLHEINITPRTLYNYVKKNLIGIKPYHLRHSLRRKRYKKQIRVENKKNMGGKSIKFRPEQVNKRQEFGHWEIDCIIDGYHNAILVMQERMTRKFVMARLEKHNSHHTISQVRSWLGKYKMKSITADNGYEFARLHEIGLPIYFTHPFAPHEKGGIENLNGRLRWDIPKSKSFNRYSESRLAEIQYIINNTPRKILNLKTPNQQFYAMLN